MSREEIEKLLGGYATGTLTPAEESALFAAALEDQRLFDTLEREQPLRELLQDPAARAALLATLDDRPAPWYRRLAPRAAIALAGAACLAISIGMWNAHRRQVQPVLVAESVSTPAPKALPAAEPAPPPAALVKEQKRPRTVAAPPKAKPVEAKAFKRTPVVEPQVRPPVHTESVHVMADAPVVGSAAGSLVTGRGAASAGASNSFVPAAPPSPPLPALARAQAILSMAKVAARATSPLTWTVLRQEPDGQFAAANPAQLDTSDTLKLRLESKGPGYVYVSEQETLLASGAVDPAKPFETPIASHGPGRRDLAVRFSVKPITVWKAAGARDGQPISDSNAAFAPPMLPPSLTITLQYK